MTWLRRTSAGRCPAARAYCRSVCICVELFQSLFTFTYSVIVYAVVAVSVVKIVKTYSVHQSQTGTRLI